MLRVVGMARARTRSVAAAERRAQQDATAALEPADFDGDEAHDFDYEFEGPDDLAEALMEDADEESDASPTRRGRRARNDDRAQGRAVQGAVTGQSDSTQYNKLAREFSKFKNEVGAHMQLLEATAKRNRTEHQRLSREMEDMRRKLDEAGTGGFSSSHADAAVPLTVDEMQDKWTIANDTWTWKQFRGTAEAVYRLMRVPFDNRAFVTMCERGSPDLDRAQPLAWRYKVITQEAMFRPYWGQVMNYITKKQTTIDVMGEVILGELVALFVVSCRPTDYVPLSSYIAMTRTSVAEIQALSESEIRTMKVTSVITTQALVQADGVMWPSSFPIEMRSGEGIRSVGHYQNEMKKAKVESTPSDVRGSAGRPANVSTGAAVPSQTAGGSVGGRPKVSTAGRCAKCLRLGHRFQDCQNAAHPQFNVDATYELLNRVGRGLVPLPA
jgi:hypothetical protein